MIAGANYIYNVGLISPSTGRCCGASGIAIFCAGLLVYKWHFLLEPLHRAMTLMVLVTIISFAAFYELTMRDAPSGVVLAMQSCRCVAAPERCGWD